MAKLDVHAHLVPISEEKLATFPGVKWMAGEHALVVDGHRLGLKSIFNPAMLIAWMDSCGIERALVSTPPPVYRQELSCADSFGWACYLNEGLERIAAESKGRLGALFYLPMEHPELLPRLLARAEAGKFEGIAIAAGGHPDIDYSRDAYTPAWEWMHGNGSFVFIHPGACRDARLANFYLENLVGNPVETGVAASHLIMAGVPAKYPGIRFCLAHAGGIFAGIVGRLQKGFDTKRPGVDLGVEQPLQAARRFWVDCIAHHPSQLRLAKEVFGQDKVLFGSDWPFPMGLERPIEPAA